MVHIKARYPGLLVALARTAAPKRGEKGRKKGEKGSERRRGEGKGGVQDRPLRQRVRKEPRTAQCNGALWLEREGERGGERGREREREREKERGRAREGELGGRGRGSVGEGEGEGEREREGRGARGTRSAREGERAGEREREGRRKWVSEGERAMV